MTTQPARLRILVMVASLLTLGAVTGVTADRAARMPGGASSLLSRLHSRMHADPVAVIESRVDLSPEQRERVVSILAGHQDEVDAAWREAHERLMATLGSVISDISAELDPEQTEQFRELVEEMHGPEAVGHIGARSFQIDIYSPPPR
jgi:hypothetical protein